MITALLHSLVHSWKLIVVTLELLVKSLHLRRLGHCLVLVDEIHQEHAMHIQVLDIVLDAEQALPAKPFNYLDHVLALKQLKLTTTAKNNKLTLWPSLMRAMMYSMEVIEPVRPIPAAQCMAMGRLLPRTQDSSTIAVSDVRGTPRSGQSVQWKWRIVRVWRFPYCTKSSLRVVRLMLGSSGCSTLKLGHYQLLIYK